VGSPISFGQLYHTGIVVEDFEAAKAEWVPPRSSITAKGSMTATCRKPSFS